MARLGLGIGWRAELAVAIDRQPGLGFVELLAEEFDGPVPLAIERLRARGLAVIPHGVALSLGGAEPPAHHRLEALDRLASRVDAPLVSEHLAFVRGGGLEAGHLLPVPFTRDSLEVVVANVRQARAALSVPLAIENIATLFDWPGSELAEADFLAEVLERADALLLLDVENVYANARNQGFDPLAYLERLPLERLAYVHVAGGQERGGLYHDTHVHPVPAGVLELLEELSRRVPVPGVMLERDGNFPPPAELAQELEAIAAAVERGQRTRETTEHTEISQAREHGHG